VPVRSLILYAYLGFVLWLLYAAPVLAFASIGALLFVLLLARFPTLFVFVVFFIFGLRH
jgi:hypothetical protein